MLKKYLPTIFLEWVDRFRGGPSGPDETCSRFLFTAKHFYAETGKPKPAAFKPHSKTNDLSVYRIDGCTNDYIWRLCAKYVEPYRKKQAVGRADFSARILMAAKLRLNPDGKPHKRHLNVEAWPSTSKMIAVELSNNSVVQRR